jgi:hypothetical protein
MASRPPALQFRYGQSRYAVQSDGVAEHHGVQQRSGGRRPWWPEFRPFCWIFSPISPEVRSEKALADAGGVGLDDADDVGNDLGPTPAPQQALPATVLEDVTNG